MQFNTFNTSNSQQLSEAVYSFDVRFCFFYGSLGRLLLFFTYLPEMMSAAFLLITIWYRKRWMFTFCVGVFLNWVFNRMMKAAMYEERPFPECAMENLGMPSHESQFIFFWATYFGFAFFEHDHDDKIEWGEIAKNAYTHALYLVVAVLVTISVVATGSHTTLQAVTGAFLGTLVATVYLFHIGVYVAIGFGDLILFQRESTMMRDDIDNLHDGKNFADAIQNFVNKSTKNFLDMFTDMLNYGGGFIDRKILLGAPKQLKRAKAETIQKMEGMEEYKFLMKACFRDGVVGPEERESLKALREKHKINEQMHLFMLNRLGYSKEDFKAMSEKISPEEEKRDMQVEIHRLKRVLMDKEMEKQNRVDRLNNLREAEERARMRRSRSQSLF